MMSANMLQDRQVLVVEDEYLIADDLRRALELAGAQVIGPVPDVSGALALLHQQPQIDCAVLDVNLGGEPSFPIADALAEREIPYLFATGYDAHALPERYRAVVRCEKPVPMSSVEKALAQLISK
jgi:CheY-like chemotaxis protein